MSEKTVVNEISRVIIDLEFKKDVPPEDVIRIATEELLCGLGRAAKNYSSKDYLFPLVFPLEMTLESEQRHWSFRLVARLKNVLADEIVK